MGSEPTGPTDIEALKRQLAELQAKLDAAQQGQAASEGGVSTDANNGTVNARTQTIVTQGGAVVHGAVQVRNGHFIGRDFVQIVTHVTEAGEDPEEAKSVIALYLHALAADLAGLKLGEIDASAERTRQTPLQLADIYVPLNTTLYISKGATLAQWLSPKSGNPLSTFIEPSPESRPIPALEALAEHRELTVVGKPTRPTCRR
ncbi:MAG: hypothetical protein ABW318_20535 [Vicinamibacterales bacterium]